MKRIRLGVNIDHVATLRQARRGALPDPVQIALIAERAGAASIVCHLREDRRHIQDEDVRRLRRSTRTSLNLEMSAAQEIVEIALRVKPDQVTLVPERRQELTTEGGLNVAAQLPRLTDLVERFHARKIAVSLFIDADETQVRAAKETGAGIIELHTGAYAAAKTARAHTTALRDLKAAAALGASLGVSVAAGHGLDHANVSAVAAIPQIEELNIGFSIVVRSLEWGMGPSVKEMLKAMRRSRKAGAR